MAYYFYDENNQKQGPFNSNVIKQKVLEGIITPETVIENDKGKSAKAKYLTKLSFPTPPTAQNPLLQTSPALNPFTENISPDVQNLPPTSPAVNPFTENFTPEADSPDTQNPPPETHSIDPQASDSVIAQLTDFHETDSNPFTGAMPSGTSPNSGQGTAAQYCPHCGQPLNAEQIVCTRCGAQTPYAAARDQNRNLPGHWTPVGKKGINTIVKRCSIIRGNFIFGFILLILGVIPTVIFMVQAEIADQNNYNRYNRYLNNSDYDNSDYDFNNIEEPPYILALLGGISIFIAVILLIAQQITLYMLLYSLWKTLPPEFARTSPGKAVGFCFIPLFNLVWFFFAFYGLAYDFNKLAAARKSPPIAKEGLALTYCIFLVLGLSIPYVGILPAIISQFILLAVLSNLRDCAVKIIENGWNQN